MRWSISLAALLMLSSVAPAEVAVTALARGGAFGLYNVDPEGSEGEQAFHKAALQVGLDAAVDWRLAGPLSLGVEVSAIAAAPEGADERHLILGLHLFARVAQPLSERLDLEVVVAGGPTLWPGEGVHAGLDARLDEARAGFSLRGAAGVAWWLTPGAALVVHLGYAASTSLGDQLAVTHDGATLSLGPRLRW